MKKLMSFFAAMLVALTGVSAQDAALAKIAKANAELKNVECAFERTRTLPATGKVIKDKGQLSYTAPGQLAMVYDNPKEMLVINGDQLYLRRAGKPSKFDTSKNALMRGLRNMLVDCIQGNARKVAQENNADISVKEVADYYHVTLTAREEGVKGFSKISLSYRKSDLLLVRMETIEFAGVAEIYSMSDFKKVPSIAASRFEIPKK